MDAVLQIGAAGSNGDGSVPVDAIVKLAASTTVGLYCYAGNSSAAAYGAALFAIRVANPIAGTAPAS